MTQQDRIAYLDGWRGAAILALLVGHFVPGLGDEPHYGFDFARLGVELFFVLSGALMGNLLFVRRMEIGLFYQRRIARLFPAFYAYVGVILVLLVVAQHRHAWISALAATLFSFNYYAAALGTNVPREYQHLWSLCIEEHCYVLLSLIAVLARHGVARDRTAIFATVGISWLLALAYTTLTHWNYFQLFWRTETRLGGIFISAGLLCWFRDRHKPIIGGYEIPAALGLGIALQANAVPDLIKYTIGTACLSLALMHLQWSPRLVQLLQPYWLRLLGVLSYSIYLWQQPFMVLRDHYHSWVCLLGALIAGSLSYFLLEQPARSWLNRHWARSVESLA